jgi:hypothetical protein
VALSLAMFAIRVDNLFSLRIGRSPGQAGN